MPKKRNQRRPLNLSGVLATTQQDIFALDSAGTTATQDLIYYLKTVIRGDTNPIYSVDSAGDLPNLIDNNNDPENIVFVRSEENVFFKTTNNIGDPVWKPVKIKLPFQGRHFGFVSGGSYSNTVESFSFATGTENSSTVGTLDTAKRYVAGQSSDINGYVSGGQSNPATSIANVNKFPFTNSFTNITSTSNLSQARHGASGISSIPNSTGYTVGGNNGTNAVSTVDKFRFYNDNVSTAIDTLTIASEFVSTNSSKDVAYINGEFGLDKLFYANDSIVFVGAFNPSVGSSGQTSTTDAYSSGGFVPPATYTDAISRFPFANDANIVAVGTLTNTSTAYAAGISSKTHGYRAGGTLPDVNTIDRFDFSSDGNAAAVGSLTTTSFGYAGHQY